MDRRQLGYFVEIVNSGSMVNASRALHVSQPSLTVVVKNLEKEVGTALLHRTPRGVVPTQAGRYLVESGQRLLHGFRELETHLRDVAAGRAGHLAVASTPTYNWGHMPELLNRLSASAPGVEVQLDDPPPLEIVRQVRDGAVDIGIVATFDPEQLRRRYDDLQVTPIGALRLVMTLPNVASFDRSGPLSIVDLTNEPWVVPTASLSFPGLAQLTERVWADHGFLPRVVRKVSTAQSALPLVAGGMGVALMPETVRNIAVGSVHIREVSQLLPDLHATALCRGDQPLTPVAARFVAIAADMADSRQLPARAVTKS